MPVTNMCLLSALVLLSVAQLALSSSCFCTNKDSTLLYNDEALTTIATEVSKINTCFLGTRFTEDDESRNKSKIQIKDLSLRRCGIGSVNQLTEGDLTDKWSNINMPSQYFGLFEDFLEIPLKDIKKRFLLAVNGGWGEWFEWSSKCSVTCAQGVTKRIRQCSNPVPANGGLYCQGALFEEKPCIEAPCPINGGWGEWFEWSSKCSVTCAQGVTKRIRQCSNPVPANGGLYCQGALFEERPCVEAPCLINGGWGEWFEWSSKCSVTCAQGVTKRIRQCSNPVPANGGIYCQGALFEEKPCIEAPCPINGGWGEWFEWSSKCSVTCAQGVTKRIRQCSNPVPANGGLYCQGALFEERPCVEAPCPTTVQALTTMSIMPPTTPSTAAPTDFRCYTCDGPIPEFCMAMMKEIVCPEPYCINELTNSNNGDKLLNRRCGTKPECDKEWWTFTSGNDRCMLYDDTQTVTNYIHCTFCCTDELCNKPTVPTADSLYKPQIN